MKSFRILHVSDNSASESVANSIEDLHDRVSSIAFVGIEVVDRVTLWLVQGSDADVRRAVCI